MPPIFVMIDILSDIFGHFWDPKKRVFFGYLFLSIIIALLWLVAIKGSDLKEALGKLFNRGTWLSSSAIADYKVFILNRMFTLFISPLLISQLAIATSVYYFLHSFDIFSSGQFANVNPIYVTALFSLTLFLVDDFSKYLVHRWMHKWPLLWSLHKVHHSAETLTPVTVYRIHPLEGILYALRGLFLQGTTIALFSFFFGSAVSLYTVLGINVLVFIFHIAGSNLRHSHIQIRYWPWLEHILISPAQHQLHHSIADRHYDKNYGVALAIWDWIFGSLHISENDEPLEFGLKNVQTEHSSKLHTIYIQPMKDMLKVIKRRFRKLLKP